MHGPDPRTRHPLGGAPHTVFLNTVITRATIEVGDFTYYHDPDRPEAFEDRNVLYHFDFIGDRLRIGRFCALATGVRFIMNGANHAMGRERSISRCAANQFRRLANVNPRT